MSGHSYRVASRVLWPLTCLVLFHSPDGSKLLLESEAINAVRPIDSRHQPHVTKGVNSVVYVGSQGYGVKETTQDVLTRIDECGRK